MPEDIKRCPINEETPQQQVSNRSILRNQQLSNELKKDLKRMGFFERLSSAPKEEEVVKQVLFVARDYRHQNDIRWYNFRLCATYGFDQAAFDELDAHRSGIKDLFTLAREFDPQTTASHERFEKALAEEKAAWSNSNEVATYNRRKAVDQLLIALAVIPYRGLLPSLLEKEILPELGDKGLKADGCFFKPKEKEKFEVLQFNEFKLTENSEQKTLDLDELEIKPSKKVPNLTPIKELFKKFILPFTRGAWPPSEHKSKEDQSTKDMFGFAVPAYDTWEEKKWQGGMVGWVAVFLDPDHCDWEKIEKDCTPDDQIQKDFLEHSWVHFTNLLRAYVRRCREASIRDMLEDYADPRDSHELPRKYFLKHLHRAIGYKTLSVSENKGHKSKEEIRTLKIPESDDRDEINEPVFPLLDTFWEGCGKPEKGSKFPPNTRRICSMFLDNLELVRAKREEGKRSGFLASAHDYSKDLNVIDSQYHRFDEVINDVRKRVIAETDRLRSIQGTGGVAEEIGNQLARLRQPQLDAQLRRRFMMAHQYVETERRLVEVPEYCIDWIKNGSRLSICRLVGALVWIPIGYWGYKEVAAKTTANPHADLSRELRDTYTWGRLFDFDAADRHSIVAEKIRDYFMRLFLHDDGKGISPNEFDQRMPAPLLNDGQAPDKQVLWADFPEGKISDRWIPVRGLLPLMVFSLRTAFQHAWSKTILDAAGGSEGKPGHIRVSVENQGRKTGHGIRYLIHLDFPYPRPEQAAEGETWNLPCGDLAHQIERYRGMTDLWSIVTPVVTLIGADPTIRITLKAEA